MTTTDQRRSRCAHLIFALLDAFSATISEIRKDAGLFEMADVIEGLIAELSGGGALKPLLLNLFGGTVTSSVSPRSMCQASDTLLRALSDEALNDDGALELAIAGPRMLDAMMVFAVALAGLRRDRCPVIRQAWRSSVEELSESETPGGVGVKILDALVATLQADGGLAEELKALAFDSSGEPLVDLINRGLRAAAAPKRRRVRKGGAR